MTEEDSLVLNIANDSELDGVQQPYSFRDGVIFLIDTTKPMFEIDPDRETSYFSQCLEVYKNILSEKLSWNKTDWMGIILMGTNKWDQDPEIKHVLTWQKFEQVCIDQMIKIEKTLENVEEFQREIGSSTNYPLYDALWYATRCFNAVKLKIPFRNIVLLTRVDNPCADDRGEQYRIRLKANDCADLKIRLSVVGLGKDWNPELFFDEFDVCSGKIDTTEDYQRTFLTDLEEQVKHASKITANLQWTLGHGVKLGVSISTITVKTLSLTKVLLKKEDNEPLEGYSYYKTANTRISQDEKDADEDEEETDTPNIALPKNVYRCLQLGGRTIKLSTKEASKLCNARKPGIDLLGFKPQSLLDILYHLAAPNLISYNESELQGSKTLFAALLKRCDERNMMAICIVTMRESSGSYLYAMIPTIEYGGFYAYKLPFLENVRNLASMLPEYVYDDTENLCPIDEDTLDLCSKFIDKSSFVYKPTMFLNPHLRTELASIESLALDRESIDAPMDSTIPDTKAICDRLGELRTRLGEAIDINRQNIGGKRSTEFCSGVPNKQQRGAEELDFKELVREHRVAKCTVKQLKEYLNSVGASTAGKKDELVNNVHKLFNSA